MTDISTEPQRARAWRESLGLSRDALAELTGYSPGAIFLFERGANSEGKEHADNAWKRYKLACLAVATLKHYAIDDVERWEWT